MSNRGDVPSPEHRAPALGTFIPLPRCSQLLSVQCLVSESHCLLVMPVTDVPLHSWPGFFGKCLGQEHIVRVLYENNLQATMVNRFLLGPGLATQRAGGVEGSQSRV